jgi:cytochrome P450
MNLDDKTPTTGDLGSLRGTKDVEPFGYFADLQEKGELVWDPEMDGWLASGYGLNKEIAAGDDLLWQLPFAPGLVQTPLGMSEQEWLRFMHFENDRSIMHGDEEQHNRHRQWFGRGFSVPTMKRWREQYMIPSVGLVLDEFVDAGRAELCAQFADRVAAHIFHQVLGLPVDDEFIERLEELEGARFPVKQRLLDPLPDPEVLDRGWAATRDMIALVEPHVLARESGAGDDLISMLWREADDVFGPGWDLKNIIGETLNAWAAGTGTTRFSTANALYLLLDQPELQARLRAGGDRERRALIEESLRLFGPLSYRPRWAKEDLTLGGQCVRKGEKVVAVSTAASRDPAHYGCPADVDLDRQVAHDHFSFWRGPHACPGQNLARTELSAILEVLLDRVADLRTDAEAPPPRFRHEILRRWEPLHALFRPL